MVVAWALRACSFAQARRTVLGLGLGWLVVVVPILAFYATRGELGRFVAGYVLVPRFVAAGMSNTPWNWQIETDWNAAFVLTPVLFFGVACLTTFDWPHRRFAGRGAIVGATTERSGLARIYFRDYQRRRSFKKFSRCSAWSRPCTAQAAT